MVRGRKLKDKVEINGDNPIPVVKPTCHTRFYKRL